MSPRLGVGGGGQGQAVLDLVGGYGCAIGGGGVGGDFDEVDAAAFVGICGVGVVLCGGEAIVGVE